MAFVCLRIIYKCSYSNSIGDVSDCAELMSLADVHEDAEPRGLATDTSDHLWVAVANVGDSGAVLEINPETQEVVSTFGKQKFQITFNGFKHLFVFQMLKETKIWWTSHLPERSWILSI